NPTSEFLFDACRKGQAEPRGARPGYMAEPSRRGIGQHRRSARLLRTFARGRRGGTPTRVRNETLLAQSGTPGTRPPADRRSFGETERPVEECVSIEGIVRCGAIGVLHGALRRSP